MKTAKEVLASGKRVNQNAAQFDAMLHEFGLAIEQDIERATRITILGLFSEVVLLTPVDTGMARANWQLGNELNSLVIEGEKPTKSKKFTLRERVWLFNNLPYIEQLEAGSSNQAPQGMVALALNNFAANLAQQLREIGLEGGP